MDGNHKNISERGDDNVLHNRKNNSSVQTERSEPNSTSPVVEASANIEIPGEGKKKTVVTSANITSIPIHGFNSSSPNFTRYDGVAIVTKVLWPKDLGHLKNWLCLINHAYNDRMKYDFVIFTTLPFEEDQISQLQKVAFPANLTVALEAPPLEEQLANMTTNELEFLYKRCNVTENTNLTWFHYCTEPGSRHLTNLGYSWQAEFRAYHIWNHPAIMEYKYMIWLDTDALPSKQWEADPMQIMVEKNLTLFYSGYPYGQLKRSQPVARKLMNVYNTSVCRVRDDYKSIEANPCRGPATFSGVAGMHHITNLEVYRKDIHQKFLKQFTGDYRFSRKNDDQLAVTIVGLMEQYLYHQSIHTNDPKKKILWHEKGNNLALRINHHSMYDNNKKDRAPANRRKYLNQLSESWPGLTDRCGRVQGKYFDFKS